MTSIDEKVPALSFKSFGFAYPVSDGSFARVLQNADFEVERGAFLVITGNTGSGKTTLLRCCNRALNPVGQYSGEILLFGKNVREYKAAEAVETLGSVCQDPDNQLICESVLSQLAFPLENLGRPVEAMRQSIAEVCHFFGLESILHKKTNDLSGGQKQLVNLASALVLSPRVLLLDEPTSQLDYVSAQNFLHALFRINRELGITVVVATHSPKPMMAYATSFARMENGALVPSSYEETLAACDVDTDVFARRKHDDGKPVLTFENLSFSYEKGPHFVLHGLDLKVEQNTIHAIAGSNGCGKTTLLSLGASIVKPQIGKVTNLLSSRQGFLPQDPKALFVCDTIADELKEWQKGCGYTNGDIENVFGELFAGREIRLSMHPYDLSRGEQQLLAFAKISLTKPEILFLDEPSKGLDPVCFAKLAEAILSLNAQGCTIVMATHDMRLIKAVADKVTLLFDGRAISTQTPDEYMKGSFLRVFE
ncbi:MAG: ATP-binding cassette domain-containing protein [Eggerthellaceae bacterium]|nr:ATP-binding cassette domain-containing protein [Eggerthellaceae bacterium]